MVQVNGPASDGNESLVTCITGTRVSDDEKALIIQISETSFVRTRCVVKQKMMHKSSHFLGYSPYLQKPNKRYGNSVSVPMAFIRNPF